MDEIEAQVVQCLAGVFPDFEPPELRRLSQATHPGWDSVAHVTISAALGEALAEATTFMRLVEQVKQQLARA
jgi:hypothetical protein